MIILSYYLGYFSYFSTLVLVFPIAVRIFGNFCFMSLYFNAFLLNIINEKFVKIMSLIMNSKNLKENMTKYQLDLVYNEASEKIDEICIQYSQMSNFVRDCSNLFPKTILILLIRVFGSVLVYSFMLFTIFRNSMFEKNQFLMENQKIIYVIIINLVLDMLNLYWLVIASAKMEQQVCIRKCIK